VLGDKDICVNSLSRFRIWSETARSTRCNLLILKSNVQTLRLPSHLTCGEHGEIIQLKTCVMCFWCTWNACSLAVICRTIEGRWKWTWPMLASNTVLSIKCPAGADCNVEMTPAVRRWQIVQQPQIVCPHHCNHSTPSHTQGAAETQSPRQTMASLSFESQTTKFKLL